MTPTVSMKAQIDADRATARFMKAKADLWTSLAGMASVILILGTIVGIVASFRLVEMLLVK